MNKFFRRLSLTTKLLLLTLIPTVLIIYLSLEIYAEKSRKVEIFGGYIERINESANISDLINALQTERRFSFAYGLKKDIDSRAQMEMQRPVTDLAIKKLAQGNDSALRNFRDYTFLTNLEGIRSAIDKGTSQDVVMQYYTTTIFRLNTLNMSVPLSNNTYLKPVLHDLTVQKILAEMVTYLGIIRSNFYNVLYTKQNAVGTLYGLAGVNDIYKSYEKEFTSKASPALMSEYKSLLTKTALGPTLQYIARAFQKFTFDSSYKAENWWKISGEAADQLKGLQQSLMRRAQATMNQQYSDAVNSKKKTLILLIVALIVVFAIMFYTAHILTQMLKNLNEATTAIAAGLTGVQIRNVSHDVIGSLGDSILKIDQNNRQLAEAADAIGKGNFNVPLEARSEGDVLGTAIIRMKNNLRRFTMEIEKNQEQFRQVADSAPVMIWMTDENKQCNFVNRGWLRFTGRNKNEELGFGWIQGMHPDDYARCTEVFDYAFIERKEYSLEYRFRRADGNYRWLAENATPVYSGQGKFQGYIGTCIDIHEMKMLEQRKDDFIKMASHELKTPVTSIKGYIQLLLTMFENYDPARHEVAAPAIKTSLASIDKQINKLNRLMSELLDLSRIDSGRLEFNMQRVDLGNLVVETVQDVQHTTRHNIIIRNFAGCKVLGDKDRLGQALLNILTNAVKYSPKTNSIEVSIFQAEENWVSVSVTDHGIGIDEQDQKKIFERFYRSEGKSELTYPGFGIGLFIANEIIHRHQGKISVESEKNKGSVFTFTLPVSD